MLPTSRRKFTSAPNPAQMAAARQAQRKKANMAGLLSVRGREGVTMAGGTSGPAPKEPKGKRTKQPSRNQSAIKESARGEACTVRIPGVCAGDPAATIWSHARWGAAGRGRSIKAIDLAGAYCCTACDSVYDGQTNPPDGYTREMVDADWCMGHFRSLVRLHEKGLL